jgi:hypothetical protein
MFQIKTVDVTEIIHILYTDFPLNDLLENWLSFVKSEFYMWLTPKVSFLDSFQCRPHFPNYYMQLIIPDRNCAGRHNLFTLHFLPRTQTGTGMQQAEMNLGVMNTCSRRYTWNGYSDLDEITYNMWDILRKIARFRLFTVWILQTSSQFLTTSQI